MSQDQLVKLSCEKCKNTNYWTRKNKKLVTRKLDLKKWCKHCRAQKKHKETKK